MTPSKDTSHVEIQFQAAQSNACQNASTNHLPSYVIWRCNNIYIYTYIYIYKHNILLHTVCCGNLKPSSTKQDSFTRIGWKMCSCGSSFGGCFRGILRDLQKKQKTIVTLQFNLRMLLLNSFTNNKIQCFARKTRKSPRNSPDHQRYFFQGILTHLGMKIAAKNW